MPPALTLTFSSDLASWISLEISEEMSRLASVTRRPMVGSSSDTDVAAVDRLGCHACFPLLGSVWAGADPTERCGAEPRTAQAGR